jgi:hypothetical protein
VAPWPGQGKDGGCRHNIYGKLGAQSRTQAIAQARELNLV